MEAMMQNVASIIFAAVIVAIAQVLYWIKRQMS